MTCRSIMKVYCGNSKTCSIMHSLFVYCNTNDHELNYFANGRSFFKSGALWKWTYEGEIWILRNCFQILNYFITSGCSNGIYVYLILQQPFLYIIFKKIQYNLFHILFNIRTLKIVVFVKSKFVGVIDLQISNIDEVIVGHFLSNWFLAVLYSICINISIIGWMYWIRMLWFEYL